MLARAIALGVLAGLLLLVGWYWWFRRYNQRRAAEVMRWIERALRGQGQIAGMEWRSASRFSLRLRLVPAVFRGASLLVQLLPRHSPPQWLLSRLRRSRETLLFEADLDGPPNFNLEVHNHRWYGKTQRTFPPGRQGWEFEQVGPFVMTTRNEWKYKLSGMMPALIASREREVMLVRFRSSSPHFSATVPLETLAPEADDGAGILEVLQELAAGAASTRF